MTGMLDASVTKQVLRYLGDRNRNQQGGWVSVADVRGALGIELEAARAACLALHERGLAELMGGFPIRPTTDKFSLIRLSGDGAQIAADPARVDSLFDEKPESS
jgi:hypothetical protein